MKKNKRRKCYCGFYWALSPIECGVFFIIANSAHQKDVMYRNITDMTENGRQTKVFI